MSLYLEQIRQLVALQKVDDAIHSVKQDLKSAPLAVEDLEKNYRAKNEQLTHIEDKLQHIREQQKRLDNEIENDVSRIKKSKSKMMQVGNTREHQAMMREMDNMERHNRGCEEELAALMEERLLQEARLEEVKVEWASLKEELEVKQASLAKLMAESEKKLRNLEGERSNTGSEVPAPVLSRYEFIRRRLDHPVIVSVDEGVCSGCNIVIPPQVYIELQSGQKILSCPNCQRLIFWDRHFQEAAE